MSDASESRGLMKWVEERYHIAPLVDFFQHKEVPVGAHPMIWYYLGGTSLFFFTVQIISGLLLLMYYQPGEATSYESIRYLTTKVPFGWLVRSVHCWSAHLMIISLVVHMLSTMLLKAYRRPRELTWLTGFGLFSLALGFGFSGYLLPWNELAFFATAVGTDSVKSVPVLGDWLLNVLRGGPDVTINTLYRFFALHVCVLPLAAFGLIGVHLTFVQRQGMALPVGEHEAPRGMKFFPNFALRDLLMWLICLIALLSLAQFFPYGAGIPGLEWELGQKADPLAPAFPGIKPEWYFLWVYQLLKEFPPHLFGLEGPQVCLVVVNALMATWVLVPWLDRASHAEKPSPAFSDLGVAAILFLLFLTLKAWDIGGGGSAEGQLPDPVATAWTCAWILLLLAVPITLLRIIVFQHRWFILSGAAVLQAVLHGIAGLPYLLAGTIAVALAVVAIGGLALRARRSAPSAGGNP
jgi:cytochrome b6